MKPWLRSVFGVLTGIVVLVAASAVFHRLALKMFDIAEDRPTQAFHFTEWAVIAAASIIAGYFVARIDSDRPMAHGFALAILMLVWYGISLPKASGGRGYLFLLGLTIGAPLLILVGAAFETRRLRKL